MTTEAVTREVYNSLLELDNHLHSVISHLEVKRKTISLKELRHKILSFLPEEMEESTALIRMMRDKSYE